jgi:hypothetical protein
MDVRIAQYISPENFKDRARVFILIPGGEKYFARFSDPGNANLPEEPFYKMIIEVFRGLNLEVLASPMLDSFRQKPVTATSAPELPEKQTTRPTKSLDSISQQQAIEVTKTQSKKQPWLWLIGLIALLSVFGFFTKQYFSKRSL